MSESPRLYRDLAAWWPILSAPEEYTEEAKFFRRVMSAHARVPLRTILELGSGGGSNASHLKKHFTMTLVDLSPGMLDVSRALNPECEHVEGDMRTVRLGRQFDAVFVHDAVAYMISEDDLRQAMRTAFVHCRPGGVALFTPDYTREGFKASTAHGGHDRGDRSMRYLEWTLDPDPTDTTYECHMAYVLREAGKEARCVLDRHVCGLFAREDWLRWMREAGFDARSLPFEHSGVEPGTSDVFVGLRPDDTTDADEKADIRERVARAVREEVSVLPYDPEWPRLFREERERLLACLPRDLVGRVEHFGSSAVPGLPAKPIIDMLVEVTSLDETRRRIVPALEALGYEYFWRPTWGDDTPPFYAWFIKRNAQGERTHHIHMVEKHFEHWERLLFRDFLIAHPEEAAAYGRLKLRLADEHPGDRVAYTDGKANFIKRVMERARG
jgi:GrpB-like predicted nucleotidyltransferase (UPF0157 family)/ubiquinone/menaquinone biosynthesis C-methylase UbiE